MLLDLCKIGAGEMGKKKMFSFPQIECMPQNRLTTEQLNILNTEH